MAKGERGSRVSDQMRGLARTLSPDDEEYWLAPYRARTRALQAGETAQPVWPPAQLFANAALADGAVFEHLIERIHAAHHITTPANPSYPVCTTDEQALDTARRRLGALLCLPTLQRLFGFAFDLLIKAEELDQAANGSSYILLAPVGEHATWTLARYERSNVGGHAFFGPASWDEKQSLKSDTTFGLRNLGYDHRYDIVTVEPVLATESCINHAAKGDVKGSALSPTESGVPVLHNGGFRIIRCSEDPSDVTTGKPACASESKIEDADDLRTGDRLMIGVHSPHGMIWRSPYYRVIRFEDPAHDAPPGWVEHELATRIGPAKSLRRLELDGAMAMPAVQVLADDPSGAIKIIADSTITLWGSDPGGVSPPETLPNGEPKCTTRVPVVEELDVSRYFSAPSIDHGHPVEALSPTLRFGWPYHVVLASVFDGGGCADPRQTCEIIAGQPSLALPDANKNGRRFLRHERLNAPMALVLESDLTELERLKPPQRGADMYVRTLADKALCPSTSRRLIAPPPVPLQFAMLHDVLRNFGPKIGTPREGLSGLSLLGHHGDSQPSRARVGTPTNVELTGSRYYPDPAASILVLGLKLPGEQGSASAPFVEPPVAIPCGARTWPDADAAAHADCIWPDVLPLHLEVKSVATAPDGPRIVSLGPRWLAAKEKLIDKPAHGAVKVHAVDVHLGQGEDLLLQAWCVPTVNQLADWFDAVEAAGVLALNESAIKGDPLSACIKSLKKILGKEIPAEEAAAEEAAITACVGAGGLQAPPRRSLLTLAGLAHRELLSRPIPALASPLPIRVTHAIDDALIPTAVIGRNPAVTRRLFLGGDSITKAAHPAAGAAVPAAAPQSSNTNSRDETRADFVTDTPISDWGLSSTEEGATGALFGGEIQFDPASTSGLVIEALCAAPFGETLDPQIGRTQPQRLKNDWNCIDPSSAKPFGFKIGKDRSVEFERQNVIALKLEGLPMPPTGRGGLQSYSLEALMAGAWGAQHAFGDALRVALPAVFNGSGARRLWLRAVPINRHAGLMRDAPQKAKHQKAEWIPDGLPDIWLPATARPSPPAIDHVSVMLTQHRLKPLVGLDGVFTVGVEQVTSLRLWHARPFFSSGEGEMLAVVVWPPGLFARGVQADGNGKRFFPDQAETKDVAEFYDEDLGPGGAYVSRWAADPLSTDEISADAFATGPFIDPSHLSEEGIRVPRAFMPIPVSGNDSWATDRTDNNGETAEQPVKDSAKAAPIPNAFLSVALQAFEPRFDPLEELWYIDHSIRTDPLPFTRLRLGLVRYQPHAQRMQLDLHVHSARRSR